MLKNNDYKTNKGRKINKIKEFFKKLLWFDFGDIFKADIIYQTMEDPVKIVNKITELNGGVDRPNGDWVSVEGYNVMISATGDVTTKSLKFNGNLGFVVKVFINKRNGEIKIYPAALFERNAQ